MIDERTTYVPTRPQTSEAIYRQLERIRKAGRLTWSAHLTADIERSIDHARTILDRPAGGGS